MNQWVGKVALITGASSGIGYDLSKRLCELGMNVVGCARNIEKIQELSKELSEESGKLLAVKCDVTEEEDIKALYKKAKTMFGGVDVCVNNAGLAHDAPLFSGTTSDWKEMLEVNVLGLCICSREFIVQLKERSVNSGHIFLMNSIAGHQLIESTRNYHFYAATKYAVTALTEGMRRELREMKSDVKVTSLSPGAVRTEFRGRMMKTNNMDEAKKNYGPFGEVLEAKDITSAVVYALSTPSRMEIHDIIVLPTHQAI